MLTHERLKQNLSYDPETGIFIWAINKRRVRAGEVAGWFSPTNTYLNITVDGKSYLLHRLAWFYIYGSWPINLIDHIDRNKTNNRINNLREATRGQNKQNSGMRKNNKSGFKGVLPHGNKWRADIRVGGVKRYLGLFKTPEEASLAYIKSAMILHPFNIDVAHKGAPMPDHIREHIKRIKGQA